MMIDQHLAGVKTWFLIEMVLFSERTANQCVYLYYHKDKPPMNLELLQKLGWPQDEDLLKYRDLQIRALAAESRKKQVNPAGVKIKLTRKPGSVLFTKFIQWVKSAFNMTEYDAARLENFATALKLIFPGIDTFEIHKEGSQTRVMPYHDRFKLIPPGEIIATRYDPKEFTLESVFSSPKYSTIVD